MSRVKFPFMRLDVIDTLESLSDADYQKNHWGIVIEGDPTNDDLSLNVHLLYDDCMVLPNPHLQVGDVLFPEDVEPLVQLEKVRGPLLTRLGDRPDSEYLSDPAWPAVVTAAKQAFDSLNGRGDPDHWRAERSNS